MAKIKRITGKVQTQAEPLLDLAECIVTCSSRDCDYPRDTMEWIDVEVLRSDHAHVATMLFIVVNRGAEDFMQMMEDRDGELKRFSKALFDSRGMMHSWLLDGGYRSGSMCWGPGLTAKRFVYILDVVVEEQFRNCGVGSWLLNKLLVPTQLSNFPIPGLGSSIYFCRPSKRYGLDIEDVVKFFRKHAFRRIGRTPYLAYSPSPCHPSRSLPTQNDPDQLSIAFKRRSKLSPDQMKKYPLHAVIETNTTSEISAILSVVHALAATTIHKPDGEGFTPLHVAAGQPNLPAVRTLLVLGVLGDLRNTANSEYTTPLERVQDKMRRDREISETMFLRWDGHSKEALICEYLLKKALKRFVVEESEDEYFKKRRLGCTCGMCKDHWLSPCMIKRLKDVAQSQRKTMVKLLKTASPSDRLLNADAILHPTVKYIPPELPVGQYRSFFYGYRAVFLAIHDVLSDCEIPTPRRVVDKALSTNRNIYCYMNKGGRVEYALDAIIALAKEESALGNWSFEERYQCDFGKPSMPRCANDLAFSLVRQQLGVESRIPNANFTDEELDLEDGEMDSEDEDEGEDEDEDDDSEE